MFITGPDVIKTVTHEEVTKEELGGAHTHATRSRCRPPRVRRRAGCLRRHARAARVPAPEQPRGSAARKPRRTAPTARTPSWTRSSPPSANKPYDMHEVVAGGRRRRLLRDAAELAPNIVSPLPASTAAPVGVVANQPAHLAGCLDIDASVKAARFVRFCDCFNIPLCTFVDVPGFLPGPRRWGMLKQSARADEARRLTDTSMSRQPASRR